MDRWRQDAERWLASERQDLDDAAETAFAEVFAALPATEYASDFVERTVRAAWQARARRRRAIVLARVAALASGALGAYIAYAVIGSASGWLVGTGVALTSRSVIWLIGLAASGMEWWSASARAGNSVAQVLAMPEGTAVLVATELLGATALYALHRLLRNERGFHRASRLESQNL